MIPHIPYRCGICSPAAASCRTNLVSLHVSDTGPIELNVNICISSSRRFRTNIKRPIQSNIQFLQIHKIKLGYFLIEQYLL
jgi:hypothetical protein